MHAELVTLGRGLNPTCRSLLGQHFRLIDEPNPEARYVLGIGDGAADALRFALDAQKEVGALVLVAPPEPSDELRQIAAPTLVLVGTRDTQRARERARRFRELIPTCYYVLVYDAGEAIDADRPEAFASLVSDFLDRREAFVLNNNNGVINP